MGREAKPLISRELEPLENRVEVLIAESRLAHSATNDSTDIEEEQLMTLLISIDPQPTQRWSARSLAATYITAQCMFAQLPVGRVLDEWLGGLLHGRVPASLCIVLVLPEYSENAGQQINKLLTDLKRAHRHHIHFTVAVGSFPSDWSRCIGIDGFVSADAKQRDSAALQVFNIMAELMAPGMLACVDAEDLRQVFGPADHPSRVTSGVWLPNDSNFIAPSEEDRLMLKTSTAIGYMPSTSLRPSSQAALLKAIRKSAAGDTEIFMFAPFGMSSDPLPGHPVVPVCLVTARKTVD